MRILIDDFLKRQSLVAIQKINDTAILVAVLLQAFAHDDVSFMRVDADVADLTLAIIQKGI